MESVTTSRGQWTKFDKEHGFLLSLLPHKKFCSFSMSFYPPIEFMLLASGYIHEWSNILSHFQTSQTIFQAMVSVTPLTKTNSCVLCRIRYTCQICVVGRNYILERRSIFHVAWKYIPNPSKKTNKISKQISRQYFQPTKASNTGRTPTRRYLFFFFPLSEFLLDNKVFFWLKAQVTQK